MSKWITKSLGEIGTYINGCAFKPEDWKTSGVPIIRIENLNNPKAVYNYYQGEIEDKYKVEDGDILVSWSASLDAYIWDRGSAVLNQHIFKVVPNEELVDKGFLFLILKKAMKGLTDLVHGATMKHVNRPVFEAFEVELPSDKNYQRSLALTVQGQLNELEKAKNAADVIKSDIGRLRQLTLESFLSEFEEIEKFALSDKAATTSGSTPSRGQKAYWEPAEIPWIKTGEIAFAPISKSEEYVSSLALKECSLKLLPENSVLIAMYGQGKTRGQSAILKVPATINQACFAILPNDTWEPEFLQLWLMYSYRELRSMSDNRGGNQANLNGDMLNSFEVPAPALDVQKEVVKNLTAALDEIEKLNNAWKAKFDDIKTLPNRLLDIAFNENEYEQD